MVAWSYMCNNLFYIFMNLTIFGTNEEHISRVPTHNFYIIRIPISYSSHCGYDISSIHHYIIFYDYNGQ